MARYLDPKNDLVFKRIFGEHPDLLQSFLNALLPLEDGQQIEELEYLTPESVPDNPLRKFSIVDVRCRDNRGRYFIVEMQMHWSSVFPSRMLLNASRAYSRQLVRGGEFGALQPVYGLGILNDAFDRKTPEFYHCFEMLNPKNLNEKITGISLVLIELPKFKPETWAQKRMAIKWLQFLRETKEENHPTLSAELLDDEAIQKALTLCEESAFTETELLAYEKYWDEISTERSMLKESYIDGKAEGLEQGIKRGIKRGKAEGLAKGEQEHLRLEQERQKAEQERLRLEREVAELKRLLEKRQTHT
jgi:predicted transposase/invertase (TIGR01784 family)